MAFLSSIFKRSREDLPAFWLEYEAKFRGRKLRWSEDSRIVAFDTETTGLDPKKDRMLSVGAIALKGKTLFLEDSFERFLFSEEDGKGHKSIPVHGIVPGQEVGKGRLEEAIPAFVHYIGDAILLGHNVGFDIAMINEGLRKTGLRKKLKNRRLDTATMAIRLDYAQRPERINSKDYSLDVLCERFSIPLHDRHNAAGDAYLTAQLFLKLLPLLRKKGIVDLNKLMK
jgi:DNA polymerase-3 subunit epsilon